MEMREEDVLAERVSWVYDAVTDKIIEVVWDRVYENEWQIFAEEYSTHKDALKSRTTSDPSRFINYEHMTTLKIVAETLYEGLKAKLL